MERYLEFAVDLARKTGAIHLEYFRSPDLQKQTKQNAFDVVTQADKAAERLIKDCIHAAFPGHAILAEESGRDGSEKAEWCWVVDPLDGTTNFSQGLPVFCVSIAMNHNGETVVGVVYAPYLDEMFTAVRGKGAFMNGKPIRCSQKSDLATAVLATGMPYDRATNPDNNFDNIGRLFPLVRGIRRMGSAAIDLAYTAAGFYDGYFELYLHAWDVAAGILIAREGGASVTLLRPVDPEQPTYSVLAAAPTLMSELSALIH